MMIAGPSLASCALASSTWCSNATIDAEGGHPINISIDNVNWREWMLVNSLKIDDTLGEQVSCSFTIVNPATLPVIGNIVEVKYYSLVMFAGTIDKIKRTTNNTLTARMFDCTCTDWSQVLVRNKIERNFTDTPIANIIQSLIETELYGEGLTVGTIDRGVNVPLVDSKGGSAFDVLRDMSGITGQTFYVDFDKAIQFRATTNNAAPLELDLSSTETASLSIDRETYRNVQRITVTGTPASSATSDALTITQERKNDNQIAARALIEGGTGRYEDTEDITHPTSNDAADLALLGIGYANLRLATSGVPRQTLTCRVRSYGFRAGQFASVDISSLSVTGTWLIQRVAITEEDGRRFIQTVDLTQSSLQLRAYESWLKIVKGGKVTVQMPGSLTNNLQVYNTPGTYFWVVPDGITTVEVRNLGASGGGSGAARYVNYLDPSGLSGGVVSVDGGDGAPSGRAISILTVIPGETLTIVVGAAGTPGANSTIDWSISGVESRGTNGTDGEASSVTYHGSIVCQGDGGSHGEAGYMSLYGFHDVVAHQSGGVAGTRPGSGIGDAVSVGGGVLGGNRGYGAPNQAPNNGEDGLAEIAW